MAAAELSKATKSGRIAFVDEHGSPLNAQSQLWTFACVNAGTDELANTGLLGHTCFIRSFDTSKGSKCLNNRSDGDGIYIGDCEQKNEHYWSVRTAVGGSRPFSSDPITCAGILHSTRSRLPTIRETTYTNSWIRQQGLHRSRLNWLEAISTMYSHHLQRCRCPS